MKSAETFEAVAGAWESEGIRYAVAHGLEEYPARIGRDLDVLVHAPHIPRALRIAEDVMQRRDLSVAHPPPLWGDRLLAGPHDGRGGVVELHLLRALAWRNVPLASDPRPTERVGPFAIDPWVSVAKRVLQPVLAGDLDRFVRRPEDLGPRPGEVAALAAELASRCGRPLSGRVTEAFEASDLERLSELGDPLRRGLMRGALRRQPIASVREGARTLKKRASQPFYPCGPVVAVVGPDGVGKSTLLDRLSQSNATSVFTRVERRHWRPNLLPSLSRFRVRADGNPSTPTAPRRTPGRFGFARTVYYFADTWLGGMTIDRVASARQRLILYDRCFLDMAVDPLRYGLSSPAWVTRLWRWVPRPDLIVLLTAVPEAVAARKAELPADEIARQLEAWERILDRSGAHVVRIDTEQPPEVVEEQARALIGQAFFQKNGAVS